MIFVSKDKRTGKEHFVCSKYWPDGKRFRRRCPNKTLAKNLLATIEAAIFKGGWRELRKQLNDGAKDGYTISEFADVYLEQYCNVRNTRPDFKKETLEIIKRIVGHIVLKDFARSDALYFETQRMKEVSAATVNRGLAVLSNLLTFAFKKEIIETHPMLLYGRLPEDQKERRFMTLEEERQLVQAAMNQDACVGAYVGILGETALRMEEGLNLKWEHVDTANRVLTVAASKNGKIRHVPLSDLALDILRNYPRVIASPWVFTRLSSGKRLGEPRTAFEAAKVSAKMEWVKGFHDFRHFRASQWVRNGVHIRDVKDLLGHRDIKTTMIYSHFDPKHVHKQVLETQNEEAM